MGFILKISLAAICSFSFGYAYDSNQSFSIIENKQQSFSEKLKKQEIQIQKLSNELEKLSQEIADLKQKKSAGLIQGYRLERNLKDAQLLSDKLEKIRQAREVSENELKELNIAYADLLDREIANERALANQPNGNLAERKNAAQKVETLLSKRMRLGLTSNEPPIPDTHQLTSTSPESFNVKDRLNALRDFEKRLLKDADGISSEIKQLKQQRFVQNEVFHLLEEESFFSEQSFVRGGVSRNSKSDAAVDNKNSSATAGGGISVPITTRSIPNSNSNDSPPLPTAAFQVPAPMSSPIETLTSTKSKNKGSNTEDPSLETAQNGSLIQLAVELGMDPKEVQVLTASLEHPENRMEWLQNRLSATKTILKRIQEIEKTLQEQFK